MQIGSSVIFDGREALIWSEGEEEKTWCITFDDDDTDKEDVPEKDLTLCEDQSPEYSPQPKAPEHPGGARFVLNPATTPQPLGWTRFVCFSDTHGRHATIPKENYPAADVLIHTGDFTNAGEVEEADAAPGSDGESCIEKFRQWLDRYPAKEKIVIAGNHDITIHKEYYERPEVVERFHVKHIEGSNVAVRQNCAKARQLLQGPNIHYLQDTEIEVCNYIFYGSPWQPEFSDWAFQLPKGSQEIQAKWAAIPTHVDVLLTHTPPESFGDMCSNGDRVGCSDLLAAIQKRAISVNVFGHVHAGYGRSSDGVTQYVNASTCNSQYEAKNPPIVFDLPPPNELRAATKEAADERARAAQ